jgi:SNF family Na+-dependent transporter
MGTEQIFDLVIAVAGLSILIWLFFYAIKDVLAKDNAKRKLMHNAIIILLCLVYIGKIIVKDLLPILN